MTKHISDFRAGDTKTIQINYGAGFDVTGWVFYFALFKEFNKSNTILVSTTAGDDALDDPVNGLVHLTLESDDSATIPPDKYYYTVKSSDSSVSPADIKTILPPVNDYKDRIVVAPMAPTS